MIHLGNNNSKRDFCVLNLTDPQLTAGEWEENHRVGKIFKKTVETLVGRLSPDLIVVSGDLSYAGDEVSYRNFADYFDSFCIPWTCCFGNHDNQGGAEAVQKVLDEYSAHPFFVFEPCDEKLGKSNFVIVVETNGKPAEGILLMDTHDREFYAKDDPEKFYWDKLSKEQLLWYREQIAALDAIGCRETTLITHIPIHAYTLAFKAAFNGDPEAAKAVALADCTKAGVWNAGYEDSYGVNHEPISCYPCDEGAFDVIRESGSTQTVICGHDHTNNWMINYCGVRFVFALKTGCGSYWEPELNGGTALCIDENGLASIRHEYVDVSELL